MRRDVDSAFSLQLFSFILVIFFLISYFLFPTLASLLPVYAQSPTPTPTATPGTLVTWSTPVPLTRPVTVVRQAFIVNDLLAIDGRLYAGADNGVFVSEDRGASWQGINEGLPDSINVLSLLAVGEQLYAGTNSGLFVREAKATHWHLIDEGLPASFVWALLAVEGRLYAGTREGVFMSETPAGPWRQMSEGLPDADVISLLAVEGRLYAGVFGGSLFISDNGGKQWREINQGLPPFFNIWSIREMEGRLYVGTAGGGVFASEDDGQQWHRVNEGLPEAVTVRSLLAAGGKLYAGTDRGVFVSQNRGQRWRGLNAGLPDHISVRSLLALDGRLLAGTSGGLIISDDDGATWQTGEWLTSANVLSLLAAAGRLYAGTSNGLFVSQDGGARWSRVEAGLPDNVNVRSLLAGQGRLLAGTSGGLFMSQDGGATWDQLNEGLTNPDVWSLLELEGRLLAGTSGGLFTSQDGGASWQIIEGLPNNISVWSLLAVDEQLLAGTSGGLFVSKDSGHSWERLNEGLPDTLNVRSLLAMTGRLYAGTANGLFVSRDRSKFEPVTGLPEGVSVEALLALEGRLFVGTSGGLFVSEDGGHSWRGANEGLPASDNWSLLALGSQMYAGIDDGLFVSADGGATWQPANGPLPLGQESTEARPVSIQELLPSDTPNEAYFATRGNGVLILTEEGEVAPYSRLSTPGSQNVQALALADSQLYVATFAGFFSDSTWRPDADTRLQRPLHTVTALAPTGFSLRRIFEARSLRPITLYAVAGDQTLFRSINNGDAWHSLPAKIPGLRTTRLLVGTNPVILYAATNEGIYRSLDEGQSWEAVLPDENVRELVQASGGVFYAATGSGLYKTSDNGQTWENRFSGDFTSVAIDPLDSQVIYAAARDRLLLSRDGGKSLQEIPQPNGLQLDRLAIGPATPKRLWAADSRQGQVVWGTVNPDFVAPSVWPRALALWGGALLVLATVGLFSLSRYSGLPVDLLLRQKLMLLPVALRYNDYRQQWERCSPVGQLILLLFTSKDGLDVNQLSQLLAELDVPVDADQLEAELSAAGRSGLLRQQSGRYFPVTLPLAHALQDYEGTGGRLALAGQIRRDHPLCANARRFFDRAGFNLVLIAEPLLYRAQPAPSIAWQNLLPAQIYARFLPGETLNRNRVLAIQQQVQQIDPQASVIFAVTDRRPTESGWAQIGALQLGEASITILPLESALLNEGLISGRESRLLRIEIEKRLGADYNPYDVRDPVAGAFSFFGREALVETLLRRLTEGRPIGIFGLRKLGKSSLLHALRDRAPFPVATINLQTVGQRSSLNDLYQRILRYWAQEIRLKANIEWQPPSLAGGDPTGKFVNATLDLLNRLVVVQQEARLGLFLDEIELITPRADGSGPDLQRYLTFLRSIRGLIDEDGRLSLVVASLNPAINRINGWPGEQNPTFNLFQEINLPPLTSEACIQMVRNIGLQIGLVYSEESLAAIAALSGGHPFLARQLCSLLYNRRNRQLGQVEADEIPGGVHQFIYDDATVAHLDNGLWQEVGNVSLWGSRLSAETNQALLYDLARADGPVAQTELLAGPNPDARQTALINLERYYLIYQPEPGHYALQFGLLREWLRRRKLGLE